MAQEKCFVIIIPPALWRPLFVLHHWDCSPEGSRPHRLISTLISYLRAYLFKMRCQDTS